MRGLRNQPLAETERRSEMNELTKKERELLDRLTLRAIANGNTVEPKAFEPTPEEYRLLHTIRIKMELN